MRVAIITLDLINELCDPKGKLARYADRIEKNQIIDKINQLTEYGRAQKQALIAHVKLVFRKIMQTAHQYRLYLKLLQKIIFYLKTHGA